MNAKTEHREKNPSRKKHTGQRRTAKGRPQFERLMLSEKFESPILLVTYAGIQPIEAVTDYSKWHLRVQPLPVAGEPPPKEVSLLKQEVLFGGPAGKWAQIKPNVERRSSVEELNLQPERGLWKRPVVTTELPPLDTPCKVCMRNGLVIRGLIIAVDTYTLLMRVGGKVSLVYKHGVHSIEQSPKTREAGEAQA